jgi:hypothetical protein
MAVEKIPPSIGFPGWSKMIHFSLLLINGMAKETRERGHHSMFPLFYTGKCRQKRD